MAHALHRLFSALSRGTVGRVCDGLMGRDHSRAHRLGVGLGVMAAGVFRTRGEFVRPASDAFALPGTTDYVQVPPMA